MLKKIVFRCDASQDIGLGHLMRCLAIARELDNQNLIIFAIIKDDTNYVLKQENFEIFVQEDNESEENFLTRLKEILNPDTIVFDKKYPYTKNDFLKIKEDGTKIVFIDHVCEGMSVADEIIFPNDHLDKNQLKEYLSIEKIETVKNGPEYVVIRDEIRELKDKRETFFQQPPVVVVTTGGIDPEGVLLNILKLLIESNLDLEFRILVGDSFYYQDEINEIKIHLPNNFQIHKYDLQEFLNANLVICTFGVTVYEMIYLQIPTICMSHNLQNASDSQKLNLKYPFLQNLGFHENVTSDELIEAINSLNDIIIEHPRNYIDGNGTKRIKKIIEDGFYLN